MLSCSLNYQISEHVFFFIVNFMTVTVYCVYSIMCIGVRVVGKVKFPCPFLFLSLSLPKHSRPQWE